MIDRYATFDTYKLQEGQKEMWFLTVVIYLAIQAITPGPNNLTCLYLGANYGFKGAQRFFISSSVFLFIKSLLCGGLNVLLSRYVPAAVEVLK